MTQRGSEDNAPCRIYLHGAGFVLPQCVMCMIMQKHMVDISRIDGDSAGAAHAVGVCMMAENRKPPIRFCFQMLPYPFFDAM